MVSMDKKDQGVPLHFSDSETQPKFYGPGIAAKRVPGGSVVQARGRRRGARRRRRR